MNEDVKNSAELNESKKILGEFWDILSPVSKQAFPIGLELYKQLKNGEEYEKEQPPQALEARRPLPPAQPMV